MKAIFFQNTAELHQWLQKYHAREKELWVGIYNKNSGLQLISWAETVEEALCFGWTESRIQKLDTKSYALRLSPRKAGSAWGSKNIKRAQELMDMGLLEAAGIEAFMSRDSSQDGLDKKNAELPQKYLKEIEKNPEAWDYFKSSTASYKKNVSRWIMKAKKEETRQKRLGILIACSEAGEKIPVLK
ncbi:MAG: YdeI/OmpD-associated family protein [Bacteroidota bacterium]